MFGQTHIGVYGEGKCLKMFKYKISAVQCIAGETGLGYFKKYIYIYLYIVDSRILWLNRFASIHPGQFKQTQGLVTAKSAWYTVGIFKFK